LDGGDRQRKTEEDMDRYNGESDVRITGLSA